VLCIFILSVACSDGGIETRIGTDHIKLYYSLRVCGMRFDWDSEDRPCSCPLIYVPERVIAFNDRRVVGPVFGVGLASIGILPTSATVCG